ncbi:MAG TPA: hypothetical protein V6C99_04605 [Oculatellaceae cyanobacterium]|jgi:hypothetical protein
MKITLPTVSISRTNAVIAGTATLGGLLGAKTLADKFIKRTDIKRIKYGGKTQGVFTKTVKRLVLGAAGAAVGLFAGKASISRFLK